LCHWGQAYVEICKVKFKAGSGMVLTYLGCKMKTELHFVWLSYVTLVLRATACQATVAKERGIEAARLQVE
jgi:hypothetical protein